MRNSITSRASDFELDSVVRFAPKLRQSPEASASVATAEFRLDAVVQFETHQEAARAADQLDGSIFGRAKLCVALDSDSEGGTQVRVTGLEGSGLLDQLEERKTLTRQLREHFEAAGHITRVCQGIGKVRYTSPEGARNAILQLDGSTMQGRKILVAADTTSVDKTKVIVLGIDPMLAFTELKAYFGQAGEVAFADAPSDRRRR